MSEQTIRDRLRKLAILAANIEEERVRLRAQIGLPAAERRSRYIRPDCGTESGYQWHRYQARRDPDNHPWPLPRHDPCGCRAGHSRHMRERERRRRIEQQEDAA